MLFRRIALTTLAVSAALAAIPHRVAAQLEVRRGMILGRVHLPNDTTPVVGALVTIVGRPDQQVTDARGEFRFAHIVPGRYEIRVRRLGMEQLVKFVTIGPGEATMHDWPMPLLPQMLSEVRVKGQMVHVSPEFQEPYRRAAWGFGDFVLKAEVERRNPIDTRSLLDGIPGVHTNMRGITFERCGSEVAAVNQTGISTTNDIVDNGALATGLTSDLISPLGVQVYIDGHRATNLMTTVEDALNSVHPKDIEIMEIYRGVARIPVEFLRDACAVIAIWTKRG
jgi:hypothetical protein